MIQYWTGEEWIGEAKPNPTLMPVDGYYVIDGILQKFQDGDVKFATDKMMRNEGVPPGRLPTLAGLDFCSACGGPVSFTANSCPRCGDNLALAAGSADSAMGKNIQTIKSILVFFTVLWVIGVIIVFISAVA